MEIAQRSIKSLHSKGLLRNRVESVGGKGMGAGGGARIGGAAKTIRASNALEGRRACAELVAGWGR
ncbi:hypothetical protein BVI434_410032 [Burkholderia vietnamiensis]|nr:hypothetical protein BVI434_410032 [Burkholderia vietnamiensis]